MLYTHYCIADVVSDRSGS